MKTMFACTFVLFFVLTLSYSVFAEGIADNQFIANIRMLSDGRGYVDFANGLTNTPPACGNTYPYSMAFNTNQEGGRGIYLLLMAAKLGGRPVYAKGSGTCIIWTTVEDLKYAIIGD